MGNARGVRRDFVALEKRRLEAVKLFAKSLNNSEIGHRLKVSNQTVSRWRKEHQRPHRRRTWAPRGQTPVLQFHFNWKTLSVIAGVTVWNFYFQIFEQAIKSEQIIEFLSRMLKNAAWQLRNKA